jgi:hypothetical protein
MCSRVWRVKKNFPRIVAAVVADQVDLDELGDRVVVSQCGARSSILALVCR